MTNLLFRTQIYYFFLACLLVSSHKVIALDDDNPYLLALPKWQEVLDKYVTESGQVRFSALNKNPARLNEFVSVVARVSPSSHPEFFPGEASKLAYHINTYNALAMQGVIDRGIPKGFTSIFQRASFFRFRKVTVGGEETNLQHYENKVIRPLGDARLHYALNCMVRDCPRLPQEAFRAETLEEQLRAATLEFFSKEKHIRISPATNTVELSSILKFYTKDFVASGRKEDLIPYVNQYLDEPIPADYNVKYIKYDWRINKAD